MLSDLLIDMFTTQEVQNWTSNTLAEQRKSYKLLGSDDISIGEYAERKGGNLVRGATR